MDFADAEIFLRVDAAEVVSVIRREGFDEQAGLRHQLRDFRQIVFMLNVLRTDLREKLEERLAVECENSREKLLNLRLFRRAILAFDDRFK